MTRRQFLLKWLMYGLALLFTCFLQEVLLTHLPLRGICPILIPMAVATVAVREGSAGGAGFGVFAGLCYEVVIPNSYGLFILGLCMLGLFFGLVSEHGVQQNFLGGVLCAAAALLLLDFGRSLFFVLTDEAGWKPLLWLSGMELLWSLIFFPLVYAIFAWVHARVEGTPHA